MLGSRNRTSYTSRLSPTPVIKPSSWTEKMFAQSLKTQTFKNLLQREVGNSDFLAAQHIATSMLKLTLDRYACSIFRGVFFASWQCPTEKTQRHVDHFCLPFVDRKIGRDLIVI